MRQAEPKQTVVSSPKDIYIFSTFLRIPQFFTIRLAKLLNSRHPFHIKIIDITTPNSTTKFWTCPLGKVLSKRNFGTFVWANRLGRS